jgi:hypothetical protein
VRLRLDERISCVAIPAGPDVEAGPHPSNGLDLNQLPSVWGEPPLVARVPFRVPMAGAWVGSETPTVPYRYPKSSPSPRGCFGRSR